MSSAQTVPLLALALFTATSWPSTSRSEASAPVWIIDEFVSQEGKWRYEGGITYINTTSDTYRGYTGGYVQVSPTQFVPFASGIGEQRRQTDQFLGQAGIRYGLSAATEVGLRSTGYWANVRDFDRTQSRESAESRTSFDSLDLTLTHRLYRGEGKSVFAFGSLGLISKITLAPHGARNANLQRGSLGISAYATDDPIVFSLTSSIGINRPINVGGNRYRQGPFYTFSPTVSLLANDRITLSSGLQFSFLKASEYAGKPLDMDRSSVLLTLGAGYAWDENLSLYVNYGVDMSGAPRTNSTQLNFIYSP